MLHVGPMSLAHVVRRSRTNAVDPISWTRSEWWIGCSAWRRVTKPTGGRRLLRCSSLAGASPVSVGAGAPSSRPQALEKMPIGPSGVSRASTGRSQHADRNITRSRQPRQICNVHLLSVFRRKDPWSHAQRHSGARARAARRRLLLRLKCPSGRHCVRLWRPRP